MKFTPLELTGDFEILSSKKKFLDSSEIRTYDPWQTRANAYCMSYIYEVNREQVTR